MHAIAEVAVKSFENESGLKLPYNLSTHGPYVGFPWSRRFFLDEEGKKIVEETARFCGWIRSAAKFPILVRLLEKTTSTRGVNSPSTKLDAWTLAKRQPSPGRTGRFLANVRWRANQILAGYGLRVSWESLGIVLIRGNRGNVGKAAKQAAAYTIRQFVSKKGIGYFEERKNTKVLIQSRGLKELVQKSPVIRAWAFDRVKEGEFSCFREASPHSCRLVESNTDGVQLMLDPATGSILCGVKAVKGWDNDGNCQWLLTFGDRSYHIINYGRVDRKTAVKRAVEAWKKQRQLEKENREFLKELQPKDRSFLVSIEDSLRAGNCRPGTESWMRQNGLLGKSFVGIHVLIPHLGDSRVRRVLQVVAKRATD